MGLTDLTPRPPAGQDAGMGIHRAIIALRDAVPYAIIPAFSPTHMFGPVKNATGGAGDELLVAFDEAGDPWAISQPAP